jgi:hypothetical protein
LEDKVLLTDNDEKNLYRAQGALGYLRRILTMPEDIRKYLKEREELENGVAAEQGIGGSKKASSGLGSEGKSF